MKANGNFELLKESYLFAEVGRRVREYQASHPDREIIRMDIGDVTLPLIRPVADAMHKAVEDMMSPSTFHGYGPEQGYAFLREAIAENDYRRRGIEVSPDDIFISDGAKCDIGNFLDVISPQCVVGVPNPVYPVYVDSNVMSGRTVENGGIVLIDCDASAGFAPEIPSCRLDVVYLCSPNNPTGGVMNRAQLKAWVDYALKNDSLIIFDSAYEAFVRDGDLPRSIYEIEGAVKVAVEVRSYSKTAGFTGLRCGYTVVPSQIPARFDDGREMPLRNLWLRRQTTKFNGASYVVQRGAEAIYSPEGKKLIERNIEYYLRNARLLREAFAAMGWHTTGGVNSPYVWVKDKEGRDSWQLFDYLLSHFNISVTPGVGFGSAGEGYIRLTGFNTHENTLKAIERLSPTPSLPQGGGCVDAAHEAPPHSPRKGGRLDADNASADNASTSQSSGEGIQSSPPWGGPRGARGAGGFRGAFNRTRLLLGDEAMDNIADKRVIIFGVGGVGSWCAEALVRSGVSDITIVDSDRVCVTNVNRQLMATMSTIGMVKVEALKERLLSINPQVRIDARQEIFSKETAASFHLEDYDYIVDCIDSLKDKAHLILLATRMPGKFFSSMGAALKLDPTRIRVAEFWKVQGCPLARALRQRFKKWKEFPAKKFQCVFSDELLQNRGHETSCGTERCLCPKAKEGPGNKELLNHEWCTSKAQINGSLMHVTSIFGLTIAGLIIKDMVAPLIPPARGEA